MARTAATELGNLNAVGGWGAVAGSQGGRGQAVALNNQGHGQSQSRSQKSPTHTEL